MSKTQIKKQKRAAKLEGQQKPQKIGGKKLQSLKNLATAIVDHAIEHHATQREKFMELKGLSEAELEIVLAQFNVEVKRYAEKMKLRGSATLKASVSQQVVWNFASMGRAVIKAWQRYAAMNKSAKQAFDAKLHDAKTWAALVMLCRSTNNKGKGKQDTSASATAKREATRWQKNLRQRIGNVKNDLRFAPIEALMVVRDFCDTMIESRKRIAAKSKPSKAKGKAIVKQLRKAA